MRYEIEVDGQTRQVTVTRTGSTYAVTVDGHEHQIDALRVDGCTLSLLVDGARSHDAVLVADSGGQTTVVVGGVSMAAALSGLRRRRTDEASRAGAGPQRVMAPMPGKVVRVLVAPGQTVQARQGVVVVEAMKMENELRSPRDGRVVEVHAREGQSVDSGALLVVIQ